MGKTSKQTSTQKQVADPTLVKDFSKITDLGALLAKLGYQPNRAVTVAGRTPAQEASFAGTQNAAGAFGMPVAASTGAPATEKSAGGIQGYSTAPGYDEAKEKLPDDYVKSLDNFFKLIGNFKTTQAKTRGSSSGATSPFAALQGYARSSGMEK